MTTRHLVLARNTRVNENGIVTSRGRRKFKPGQSALYIKDAGEAREIEQQYGAKGTGDVHVFEDDKVARYVKNDKSEIHNYTFGAMTSPAAIEFWDRYEKKKNTQKKRITRRKRAEVNNGL